MRILIVARGYPNESFPLNGNFEATQARGLKSLGHEVIYIALGFKSQFIFRRLINGEFRIQHKIIDGIDVYERSVFMPYGKLSKRLFYYIRKLHLINLYKRVLKKHGKPDIVHSHYLILSASVGFFKYKYQIPLIITEHLSRLNNHKISAGDRFLGEKAFKYPDLVIAVSKSLSDSLLHHFGIKSIVIHNMVDNSFFNQISHNREADSFSFISIGSLIQRKGFDILIKAFAISNFEKNVFLSIVGDGPLKNELQLLIDTLELSNQIKLLGQKNSLEIQNLLTISDAFVLASRVETFGVVFIEALAKGLPVIGTICGGPEEFINETNGVVVPVDDVDSLSNALKMVHSNINKYNSIYISKQCSDSFSEERIAQLIVSEYKKVLSIN